MMVCALDGLKRAKATAYCRASRRSESGSRLIGCWAALRTGAAGAEVMLPRRAAAGLSGSGAPGRADGDDMKYSIMKARQTPLWGGHIVSYRVHACWACKAQLETSVHPDRWQPLCRLFHLLLDTIRHT